MALITYSNTTLVKVKFGFIFNIFFFFFIQIQLLLKLNFTQFIAGRDDPDSNTTLVKVK